MCPKGQEKQRQRIVCMWVICSFQVEKVSWCSNRASRAGDVVAGLRNGRTLEAPAAACHSGHGAIIPRDEAWPLGSGTGHRFQTFSERPRNMCSAYRTRSTRRLISWTSFPAISMTCVLIEGENFRYFALDGFKLLLQQGMSSSK